MLRLTPDSQHVLISDGRTPAMKMTYSGCVALTSAAVKAVRSYLDAVPGQRSDLADDCMRGARWLEDVYGIHSIPAFRLFAIETLPRLLAPPDPSRIVRCRRCGRVLTDRISVALGMGACCRAKPYAVKLED